MNQFTFPYIPNFSLPPVPPPKDGSNIYQEIEKLKQEINNLKKRISKLEKEPQNDYLQKEDGMYMLWTQIKCSFLLIIIFYGILIKEKKGW